MLVDAEDYERMSQFNWFLHKGYAIRNLPRVNGRRLGGMLMHREIMGVVADQDVDHINGVGLDNRKVNLRACVARQNGANQGVRKNNSSGYKGVAWFKRDAKWRAYVAYLGKQIHLGYFEDKHDAAKAYNEKAQELWGEYARMNDIKRNAYAT